MIRKIDAVEPAGSGYTPDIAYWYKAIQAGQERRSENSAPEIPEEGADNTDGYIKTVYNKTVTVDIQAIKRKAEEAAAYLRALVERLSARQEYYQKIAMEGIKSRFGGDADEAEQARLSISEDGEFGVKAVSDRIVRFAAGACGEDKTKIEGYKAAVNEGYEAAAKAFGGELPGLCARTREEIMQRLDGLGPED